MPGDVGLGDDLSQPACSRSNVLCSRDSACTAVTQLPCDLCCSNGGAGKAWQKKRLAKQYPAQALLFQQAAG